MGGIKTEKNEMDTGIIVLCKVIETWKKVHGSYPTRKELIGALENKSIFDGDLLIDRADQAGAVEEIDGRIVLTEFGSEIAKNID